MAAPRSIRKLAGEYTEQTLLAMIHEHMDRHAISTLQLSHMLGLEYGTVIQMFNSGTKTRELRINLRDLGEIAYLLGMHIQVVASDADQLLNSRVLEVKSP